jgi:malonyl-CoA decarboxylase
MTLLADLLSTVFERRYRRENQDAAKDGRPLVEMATELVGSAGETSGIALAEEIMARFKLLNDAEKLEFFRDIARTMNIDPERARSALDAYERAPSRATYRAFSEAAEPSRQELVRRLNRVPGATGTLVKMRADLLRLSANEPELQALDMDFRHLFASWFNRGFLVLRPISWESPAHILEKIIAYEAVHAIDSWDDLRNRLEPADRRCFAFFHPAMPDEPLIFVEVALTKGTPNSVQALLAQGRTAIAAQHADTAVFYSISNCQAGLASISFGNSLIKQVAADLASELPGVKTFVTLSPIPGLRKWFSEQGYALDTADPEVVRRAAAYYLINAKNNAGAPYDPVARFHLGNGAIVHAVHGNADSSANGMAQSAGAMVNYLYDLKRVAQNHEKFATKNSVTASADVRALASAAQMSAVEER